MCDQSYSVLFELDPDAQAHQHSIRLELTLTYRDESSDPVTR